jgi:hypothetical protein
MKGGENREIRKWGLFVNSGLGSPRGTSLGGILSSPAKGTRTVLLWNVM